MSRRFLIPLLIALACAVCAPAASAATVRVIDTDGDEYSVDLRDLQGREDVKNTGYAIRSSSGTSTETVQSGYSLDLVIAESGADKISYGYAEVVRPSGGAVILENGQIRQSGYFPDGKPVVYERGGSLRFLRPSSGSDDMNASDWFSSSPLLVRLRSGSPIRVDMSASTQKVKVDQEVSFTAKVTQSAAGSRVDYAWSFGDGTKGAGPSVTHKWAKPGSYAVVVGATTADDEVGFSDIVRITVGKTKKGGPNREGGGEDKRKDASDSGASDGTGGSPTGVVGGTGTGTSDGTTGTTTPADPDREKREPPPPTALESVTGEVLDAPATVPESTEEVAPPTARTGTPEQEDEQGAGIPGEAFGAAAILALFGLGALAELERIRPGGLLKLIPRVGR